MSIEGVGNSGAAGFRYVDPEELEEDVVGVSEEEKSDDFSELVRKSLFGEAIAASSKLRGMERLCGGALADEGAHVAEKYSEVSFLKIKSDTPFKKESFAFDERQAASSDGKAHDRHEESPSSLAKSYVSGKIARRVFRNSPVAQGILRGVKKFTSSDEKKYRDGVIDAAVYVAEYRALEVALSRVIAAPPSVSTILLTSGVAYYAGRRMEEGLRKAPSSIEEQSFFRFSMGLMPTPPEGSRSVARTIQVPWKVWKGVHDGVTSSLKKLGDYCEMPVQRFLEIVAENAPEEQERASFALSNQLALSINHKNDEEK